MRAIERRYGEIYSESHIEQAGARVRVTECQRETGGDKGRASKSQRKPQREPEGTRVS